MLHEALMLEIYRQALNAGALPTARPRSTESANSSERCPSHDSNSSDNGNGVGAAGNGTGIAQPPAVNSNAAAASLHTTFPAVPQTLPAQPPSMEAYLHMVAAAAQQYGFPLAAAAAAGPRLPLPLPNEAAAPFKLPPQASPTASSNNSEALDFRTNLFGRAESAEPEPEPPASEEEEDYDDGGDGANNPLDLSVGTRKRSAEPSQEPDSSLGQIQVKKIFKTDSPPTVNTPTAPPALLPGVNPYLAAVAAANIFRAGQFPDWNGKSDLVVDPLEKMSDIVKGGAGPGSNAAATRKDKPNKAPNVAQPPAGPQSNAMGNSSANHTNAEGGSSSGGGGVTKARHNIWQSHWQNKGVASSVFRCVWCKQSFPTLEALTTHMKDSKHCGVNVPPFGNLPSNNERHHHVHHSHAAQPPTAPHVGQSNSVGGGNAGPGGSSHNLRKPNAGASNAPSANVKNAFQYRGDPPTPLPRKLVRGQNVWLGKGVEQAMQILKCMRCGESFRSLGEMTKHMQETQHYTNILSQEQTISMKSSAAAGASANADGAHGKDGQNSLSSEESRTLSAVLTCKVCDKAFNSLGDLSNHMAKNNHYAEPLLQSMGGGGAGSRKRPAPKKREKSLPVRKLLEMKGAAAQPEELPAGHKSRMALDGTGLGPGADKSEAALFAERMRQYITGVKSPQEEANAAKTAQLLAKSQMNANKSPELEPKNGTTKPNNTAAAASSVLSAIEQMFTTSFDTPPRHASLPATSPSNSSTKNTSPVASSILKRLGIDETVDYNKPLIDTSDPYFQHYRYTSSERSGSECSAETHAKRDAPTPTPEKPPSEESSKPIKQEPKPPTPTPTAMQLQPQPPVVKMEIKSELSDEHDESASEEARQKPEPMAVNGSYNNNNNNVERVSGSPKSAVAVSPSPPARLLPPRSPADSQRSGTPKSPASSQKSYDGGSSESKKYPSDSLNALSSMFDSLGSSSAGAAAAGGPQTRAKLAGSPENLSAGNSLAALRQFCVKKEKTA